VAKKKKNEKKESPIERLHIVGGVTDKAGDKKPQNRGNNTVRIKKKKGENLFSQNPIETPPGTQRYQDIKKVTLGHRWG